MAFLKAQSWRWGIRSGVAGSLVAGSRAAPRLAIFCPVRMSASVATTLAAPQRSALGAARPSNESIALKEDPTKWARLIRPVPAARES